LLNDPGKPMMNRALQTPLAPGSTFKIVTAIAAAKAGIWNAANGVSCGGGFRLGSHTFKCMGRHGAISFERAMEKSCNTYFCTLGYRVGRERFVEIAKEVGLAQPTGIEIGGEHRGTLPDERWLARNRKPPVWYGGDVVNASIGQGAVGATPIQMANIMALVANDGVAYVPHLVRSARSFEGLVSEPKERRVAHRIELPASFWASLRRSLGRVIESGTARSAQIPNVAWGGKTGSAEHRKGALTHSWFVGMAPLDQPKIAVCVRVEAAGHGGDIAAPIAKAIVERYLAAERKSATAARASAASADLPDRS
jgi:penicillin-binding protein 2